MAAMADDVTVLPTLSEDDQAALQGWVRDQRLGSTVGDVAPLTGGTQNIVVHLRIDDRPMVLRRPPVHPRATSDKTMLREIAVLRTLAGSDVPHPGFITGCADLSVLGVVLGAFLLGVINNALTLVQISPFWQLAAQGLLILLAVIVDSAISRRMRRITARKSR